MKFSVSKLRGRIIELFGNLENFADNAECSRAAVSNYLNHKTYLGQKTILKWARCLKLSDDEIPAYFFVLEVDEIEPND